MARVSRPRRVRTATESLLSITLILETFVMFFAAIVVRGLGSLPDAVALGGGAVFIGLLLVASVTVRYAWGVVFGFVLQTGMIALGVLDPLMYLVGIGFAALYTFCYIKGEQLERAKRAHGGSAGSTAPSPQGDK
jgi:hypothetical protein